MPAPTLPNSAYALGFAGPSAYEQLMVELINRARLDPGAEVDRIGTAAGALASGVSSARVQVLAVVKELDASAQKHSDAMLADNFFDHTNPNTGKDPFDRMADEGYSFLTAGENIGWIGSFSTALTASRIEAHQKYLWESDGHQANMLRAAYSEVGIGFSVGAHSGYPESSMITENFGDRGYAYLTGVVIDDLDGDRFYDIGEGQGGVRITAWNDDTVAATSTWSAGGYSLRLDPGTYTVRFEGGALDGVFETTVKIGSDNVKLDVLEGEGTLLGGASGPQQDPVELIVADFLTSDDFDFGSKRNDKMNGSSSDDLLNGRKGNDTIKGKSGDDFLSGDKDKDKLYGNSGDDVLWGGKHNDKLWGGSGADIFIYKAGDGRDRIYDFHEGQDVLAFKNVGSDFDLADHATVRNGNLYIDMGADDLILLGVTDAASVDYFLI